MRKMFVFWILLPLINPTCRAQSIDVGKLDNFFNALAEHNLANGSIAISQNGKLLYQKAIGYAYMDTSRKMAADVNTRYRIGSVSKLFTAVMMFQLVEEGKISLNHKIDTYFPSLPNAGTITIANLLNHRSGLHDYTKETNFEAWMDKPKKHEELIKLIAEKKTDFPPGTKTEYNNTNYLLLSYVIEQVCKGTYAEQVKKRIVDKVGLTHTGYGQPIDPNKNESLSYTYFDNRWTGEKQTDMSIHSGSGSLVSTPADLVKFLEALYSNQLVSPSSLKKMETLTEGFGYGLEPWEFSSTLGYGKGGKIEGFLAYAFYFPKQRLAVAYCTNGYVFPMNDIVESVLKICFNQPYIIPAFDGLTLKGNELNKYTGTYKATMMPITITCTRKGTQLLLETKGQAFAAIPINENLFMNKQYGYFFSFNPDKEALLVKEKANVYYLKK
jgi:D-alanyl-D-alanine carboxypeptidase